MVLQHRDCSARGRPPEQTEPDLLRQTRISLQRARSELVYLRVEHFEYALPGCQFAIFDNPLGTKFDLSIRDDVEC